MGGIDKAGCCDLGKVTSHGHHAQVFGCELNLCVIRVKLPDILGSGFRFILCCHVITFLYFEISGFCMERELSNFLVPYYTSYTE